MAYSTLVKNKALLKKINIDNILTIIQICHWNKYLLVNINVPIIFSEVSKASAAGIGESVRWDKISHNDKNIIISANNK